MPECPITPKLEHTHDPFHTLVFFFSHLAALNHLRLSLIFNFFFFLWPDLVASCKRNFRALQCTPSIWWLQPHDLWSNTSSTMCFTAFSILSTPLPHIPTCFQPFSSPTTHYIAICTKVWNRVNLSIFASPKSKTCSTSMAMTRCLDFIILVVLESPRWYLLHNVYYKPRGLKIKFICGRPSSVIVQALRPFSGGNLYI